MTTNAKATILSKGHWRGPSGTSDVSHQLSHSLIAKEDPAASPAYEFHELTTS